MLESDEIHLSAILLGIIEKASLSSCTTLVSLNLSPEICGARLVVLIVVTVIYEGFQLVKNLTVPPALSLLQ